MSLSVLTGPRALFLVAVLSMPGMAAAQSERPLPSVDVVAAGGLRTPLQQLALDGQWLIVSIAVSSPPSSRLLEALANWELGARTSRLLIVVSGVADAAALGETWSARLPGARWTTDPTNEIARALNLRGAPMVLGVRGQQIAWMLAGVLNDPSMVREVATSWLLANP